MKKSKIIVEGTSIAILPGDFFSLTDIARKFNERTDYLITNSFQSTRIRLEEWGLADATHEQK